MFRSYDQKRTPTDDTSQNTAICQRIKLSWVNQFVVVVMGHVIQGKKEEEFVKTTVSSSILINEDRPLPEWTRVHSRTKYVPTIM